MLMGLKEIEREFCLLRKRREELEAAERVIGRPLLKTKESSLKRVVILVAVFILSVTLAVLLTQYYIGVETVIKYYPVIETLQPVIKEKVYIQESFKCVKIESNNNTLYDCDGRT